MAHFLLCALAILGAGSLAFLVLAFLALALTGPWERGDY